MEIAMMACITGFHGNFIRFVLHKMNKLKTAHPSPKTLQYNEQLSD